MSCSICFVSCPKQFVSPWAEIQERAIRSWLAVDVESEVCLVAPASDIETVPEGLVRHAIVAKENAISKLPFFQDIMEAAYEVSDADVFCYLNCDIILPSNFGGPELAQLSGKFMVIGSRWDVMEDVLYPDDTSESGIVDFLKTHVSRGEVLLHAPTGIDYFMFPRGLFNQLRPLVVGRGGYDSALLAFCMRQKIQMVDATESYPILHQFHDYSHVKGAKQQVFLGGDAEYNLLEHDVLRSRPIVLDADYALREGQLVSGPYRCGLIRRIELTLRYRWKCRRLSYLFRALYRLLKVEPHGYPDYEKAFHESL